MAKGSEMGGAKTVKEKPTQGRPLFDQRTVWLSGLMGVGFVVLGVLVWVARPPAAREGGGLEPERQREWAAALVEAELYEPAIEAYEKYLASPGLTEEQRAKTRYVVADLYLEKLQNYPQAMANYLQVKYLFPDSDLTSQVNSKIVECLEKMGRSLDAQAELKAATSLKEEEKDKKPGRGPVVAKIGEREITMGELEDEIDRLPAYRKREFSDENKKFEFLQQYVATELLYDTAQRRGLDRDPQILAQVAQMKKGLMVERLIDEEVRQKVTITEDDLKLYYEAHKDRYVEKKEGPGKRQKSLAEVRDQVEADLRREREESAYQALVKRMLEAEKAQIFEEHFPGRQVGAPSGDVSGGSGS